MAMQTLVVHMFDLAWTQQALHLACQRARESRAEVCLLRLIPVRYARWLGTEFASQTAIGLMYADLAEHIATVEDYGFHLNIHHMFSMTVDEALLQAAQHLNAVAVFTQPQQSVLPYWGWLQARRLEKMLKAQGCELCLLDSTPKGISDKPHFAQAAKNKES
jgi:hypothetical protein